MRPYPWTHANLNRVTINDFAIQVELERVHAWRKACPDITLRSTFIVGFPGETDAEFEELLAFLEEARLDRVGCFEYSAVEGAVANDLPDAVAGDTKAFRKRKFMETQERISRDKLRMKIGRTLTVLVDEPGIGRSSADAPEIDGQVRFRGGKQGEFAEVLIERADAHDLYGRRQ